MPSIVSNRPVRWPIEDIIIKDDALSPAMKLSAKASAFASSNSFVSVFGSGAVMAGSFRDFWS